LQGKWIAVAKSWLQDNCPCTVEDYFQNVPQLMPTHIAKFRKLRDPQLSASRDALNELRNGRPNKGINPSIDISNDVISYRIKDKLSPRKCQKAEDKRCISRRSKYDYSWIPLEPKAGAEIIVERSRMSINEYWCARMMLLKNGYRSIGNGVYRFDPAHLTKQPDALQ